MLTSVFFFYIYSSYFCFSHIKIPWENWNFSAAFWIRQDPEGKVKTKQACSLVIKKSTKQNKKDNKGIQDLWFYNELMLSMNILQWENILINETLNCIPNISDVMELTKNAITTYTYTKN